MKMKRTVLVCLLLLAVLLFAACGEKEEPKGTETGTDVPETLVPETSPGSILVATGSLGAMCLDGEWKVKGDAANAGVKAGWFRTYPSDGKELTIPGSENDVEGTNAIAWFFTKFKGDAFNAADTDRVYLEMGGVCYRCTVWLNGKEVGGHTGAYNFFTLDVTDAIKFDGQNVLAVRVEVANGDAKIDGLTRDQLPIWSATPKIGEPVYVYVKPTVNIEDVMVVPSCKDGKIDMTVTLRNAGEKDAEVSLGAWVREKEKSAVIERVSATVTAPAGESTHHISVTVPNFKYWSPDAPNLYQVGVTARAAGSDQTDEFLVKTGFKTLVVDSDGFFVLNGSRIYIKCAHTSAHYPGTIETAKDYGKFYQTMMYLKSTGFNTVRFLQCPATPEIMQICDEIGLMVYEEHPMSWLKKDSAKAAELFDQSVRDVLLRDRNHVSLAMFGMLNETEVSDDKTKLYKQAVAEIKTIRAEAPELLFLLGSGRWDGNKRLGSASNPGSTAWDAYMGDERATAVSTTNDKAGTPTGLGDVHYYPEIPYGQNARQVFEKYAKTARAVFISEAGAGSQVNIISEYLLHQQTGISDYGLDIGMLKQQTTALHEFFDEYGLDRVWSTPEELIEESEVYQASQRALLLTMIRRLGNVNGHSITMVNDVGYRGEGIIETSGSVKNAMTETLQAALDDLRFCISVQNPHSYAGDGVKLEIVLSNLGVLKVKTYKVRVRITGDCGTVYDKTVEVKPGKKGDYTDRIVPVLDETIPNADWQSGTYKVSAEMLTGAHATCGTEKIYVTNRAELPKVSGTVYTYSLSTEQKALLEKAGAKLVSYTPGMNVGTGTVLIASNSRLPEDFTDALWEAAKKGAHVAILTSKSLGDVNSSPDVPFAKQGTIAYTYNWLYHFDGLVMKNALTEGLLNGCIMDTQYYGSVWSNNYFTGMAVPNDVAVANVYIGNDGGSGKTFESGYQLGSYRFGSGVLTLTTLNLAAGNPAADRILLNIAGYKPSTSYTGGEYKQDDSPKPVYVSAAKGIKIDGVVTPAEWGEPVLKGVNYAMADESANDALTFSGEKTFPDSDFDLYYAYDSKFFYSAAVVRNVDRDDTAKDDTNLSIHAGFGVMFARFDPNTVVPRITYQGQIFEQYVHINYYLLANGNAKAEVQNEGVDWTKQVDADYECVYDESTRTMTYEVRIPISQSNVTPSAGARVAVSSYVRLPYANKRAGGLFLYGSAITAPRGASKTPMQDGSVIVTLK